MALALSDPSSPQDPRAARSSPIDRSFGTPDELLRRVIQDFEASYAFLRPYFTKFLRFYRMYRSHSPKKARPWRADVFVPIPFASVEHGLATIIDAYSQRPLFTVLPREGTDYTGAKQFEKYLEWEDDDAATLLPLFSSWKDTLNYGTGWQKVLWDWAAQRNSVEDISTYNCFPDPWAEDVDDAEYIIHRALRSPTYVQRMVDAGFYDLQGETVEGLARMPWGQDLESEQLLGEIGLSRPGDQAQGRYRIEVLERWSDNSIITVLNRHRVVRAWANGYGIKPFVRYVDHFVPHELMGIGEHEVIERLVSELNDIRGQRLDVVSMMINNILVASKLAGIDPETLIWRPGQTIWANDIQGIRPLIASQSGNPALGVQEETVVRFDVQEATGNWGYNQGQVPNRREAATTVLALQRAAGLRFTSKMRYNETGAMRKQAKLRMRNAQRFLPATRWIRVTNQVPVQLRREDLAGEYDFIPTVSSAEPREARRAAIGQILPILMNSERIRDDKLLAFVLDLYNVREKEAFLRTDEEMQQVALARALQQVAARAGGNSSRGGERRMPTMIGGMAPEAAQLPSELEDLGGNGDGGALDAAGRQYLAEALQLRG
jgi:hypothetical protein